jgi:phosphate transport system substrate-binding protein
MTGVLPIVCASLFFAAVFQAPTPATAVPPAPAAAPAPAPGTGVPAPQVESPVRPSDAVNKSVDGQAIGSAERAVAEALRGVELAQLEYTTELSELVEAFPSYSPHPTAWSGRLRIVGSSTMGPLLTNLGIGFETLYPKLDITVQQGGSEIGLAALREGRCELAAMSRPLTSAERDELRKSTGKEPVEAVIGLDGVCVFVNRDNPVPGLTKAQCNGIFSIQHSRMPRPIYRWNQADPASPLGDEFITLYVPDLESGTLSMFRSWCMPAEEITTSMRSTEPGPSSVVNACCAYPAAIGIAGFGNRQARARMVPVGESSEGPFIAPTVQTIRDASYPMTRPLTVAFLAAPGTPGDEVILDFLRFVMSETGQDQLVTLNFVPPKVESIPAWLGTRRNDLWN